MEAPNIRVISGRPSSPEEDRLNRLRVMLQQTGGDPSAVLQILSTIIKNKDWRNLHDHRNGDMSFLGYFKELGWSKDDLTNFVENMHHRHERPPNLRPEIRDEMEELRRCVRDLANPPLLPFGGMAGNQNAAREPDENGVAVGHSVSDKAGYHSSSGIISRLKRDNPALAEKVILGEITPHAAAIQSGFRKRTVAIPIESEAAVRLLVKHFQGEFLEALVRGLANWAGYELVPKE